MAYNLLSGTVLANESVVFKPSANGNGHSNAIVGEFHGDGRYLENVARIVANGTTDYILTVGANADSLVGEPNLRFNGSRLLVNGNVTASTLQLTSLQSGLATTSSFLALDSNNNVVLTSSAGGPDFAIAQGPINSLQFHSSPGDISGSGNVTLVNDTLFVTGSLVVSGNIEAHSFNIIQTNLLEINSSGSTSFGNSSDDVHKFKGEYVEVSASLVLKRTTITSNQTISSDNYYIGVDTGTPSASITVTLPDAATLQSGQTFVFKDEGGKADQYNVLINGSGSQKIDNENQVVLESPYASLSLYCDGVSRFYIT